MIPQYSVIIPAYRSMDTIANLLERLVAQMEAMGAAFEIIVVEDCRCDDTWAVLQSLLAKFPCLKIIKLVRNFGQHNALMCGFAQSRGELVITLDDDLQNPPEEIPKLIQKINEGFDVVYGVPARKKHNLFRNFGFYLVRGVYKWCGRWPGRCRWGRTKLTH